MAKKKSKSEKEEQNRARKAERNAKNAAKAEAKDKKLAKKNAGSDDEEDMDIDEVLANYAKKQAEFEKVDIEVLDKPPSRRLNSTMVASPIQGKHELFLFGGETTEKRSVKKVASRGGKQRVVVEEVAAFYNDLYQYSTDTDQWRLITSPNSPLPRSGHSMCAHPSGIVVVFGGEFSSPKQTTFYHYGDTWVLDAQTKEWTMVETKKGPTSRSGHRMTVWKNYVLLHGGFKDLGTSSLYLNDLWAFDVTSYKWHQIEFPPTQSIPEARSGHSFLAHPEGGVIWGGYSKVMGAKGIQKGKVHTEAWLLKMKPDLKGVTWERRKKATNAPSRRVGCSMTYHKGRGILFGGVFDEEETEESLNSVFYNDLYAYQTDSNKWFSLKLRAPKKRPAAQTQARSDRRDNRDADLEATLSEILEGKLDLKDGETIAETEALPVVEEEEVVNKKEYTFLNGLPHARFNATLCVVDDTLYIFGGAYEFKEKEYHLDSMYAIDFGRLDGTKVLFEDIEELTKKEEEGDDDDEFDDWEDDGYDDDSDVDMDDDEEEDEDEVIEEEEEDEEEEEEIPDARPWLPQPKPFETLRQFYLRTSEEHLKWATSQDPDFREKDRKRAAFELAEDRWWERREFVRIAEDKMEELGGVSDVIEKDANSKPKGRR